MVGSKKGRSLATSLFLLFVLVACKPDDVWQQPGKADAIFAPPAHFPVTYYDFSRNPVTAPGFELGRRLFYDPILSRDSSISCASCHRQEFAFSDGGKAVSHGIGGRAGTRNSPGLFNLAWSRSFMWDGGVNHLEVFPLAPITEAAEMDETLAKVMDKLRKHPVYPGLFEAAFGPGELTDQRFLFALAQFQNMLVSANSPYDRFLQGKEALPAAAMNGLAIFRSHCSGCHSDVLFTDHSFRDNGMDSLFADAGRGRITQLGTDTGRFKVPSLRNVALTAPYMHDGRFVDLSTALEHYRTGLSHSASMDALLHNAPPLSATDIIQLQVFLEQLTDHSFINNPLYKNPF